jgi:acyl-CoA hydrolase
MTKGAEPKDGKRVADSSVIMAQMMIPQDANPAGNVHGGVVVKIIDEAAGVVAARHARTNVVTASIDRMDFHQPVFVGDLLFFKASLNYAGRTSMEIGVRVEAENLLTGEVRHAASAYLTFVAIDGLGKPVPVPPLIVGTDEERRRNREAKDRRDARLAGARRKEDCRKEPGTCS